MQSLEKMLARSRQFTVVMSVLLLPEIALRLPHFKAQNNIRSAILNVLKVCLTTLSYEFAPQKKAMYFTGAIQSNIMNTLKDNVGPVLNELILGSSQFPLLQSKAKGCMSEVTKILYPPSK